MAPSPPIAGRLSAGGEAKGAARFRKTWLWQPPLLCPAPAAVTMISLSDTQSKHRPRPALGDGDRVARRGAGGGRAVGLVRDPGGRRATRDGPGPPVPQSPRPSPFVCASTARRLQRWSGRGSGPRPGLLCRELVSSLCPRPLGVPALRLSAVRRGGSWCRGRSRRGGVPLVQARGSGRHGRFPPRGGPRRVPAENLLRVGRGGRGRSSPGDD